MYKQKTHVLGADSGGLEELVHTLKQDHLRLLQRSVPCQPHGLLDDACTITHARVSTMLVLSPGWHQHHTCVSTAVLCRRCATACIVQPRMSMRACLHSSAEHCSQVCDCHSCIGRVGGLSITPGQGKETHCQGSMSRLQGQSCLAASPGIAEPPLPRSAASKCTLSDARRMRRQHCAYRRMYS